MEKLVGGPFENHSFAAECCCLTKEDNSQERVYVLVVKEDSTKAIVAHTGLEVLCVPYTGRVPIFWKEGTKQSLYAVCTAMNFIFKHNWWKYHVNELTEVTVDMLYDEFDHYIHTAKIEGSGKYRGSQSIKKHISAVSAFFANIKLCNADSRIELNQLLEKKIVYQRNGNGKGEEKFLPTYKWRSLAVEESKLMRDVPEEVINILLSLAEIYDPMLVFVIIVGITAGLRIAEICNMRQEGSEVCNTPGISIKRLDGHVAAVDIDITREFALRSDQSVSVGGIKKHLTASVYPEFIEEFLRGYEYHKRVLQKCKYDKKICPMFVNSRGQAMSSDNMQKRFNALVEKHLIPTLYTSGNPYLIAYAQEIESRPLRSHALRHFFTVRLVLAGLNREAIAKYRRDKSVRSAEIYVRNKGAFEKQLQAVHSAAIEDMIRR